MEDDERPTKKVKVSGGDWSHATLSDNKTIHNNTTTINHYGGAVAYTPSLESGKTNTISGRTTTLEEPICKDSSIYRGFVLNGVFGKKYSTYKVLPLDERRKEEVKQNMKLQNNENILSLLEADTFNFNGKESIYIKMEECFPLSLWNFVNSEKEKGRSFSSAPYKSYCRNAVGGVSFLHSKDIMTGDLSPHNVVLSVDRKRVKICNYGFSTGCEDLPSFNGWKPPEVLHDPGATSCDSDVYRLGLVSYYMLSYGKHAFGNDSHSWNHYILKGQNMNLLGMLIPDADAAIEILTAMLRLDPNRRPSAKEVSENSLFSLETLRQRRKPNRRLSAWTKDRRRVADANKGIAIFDRKTDYVQFYNPRLNAFSRIAEIYEDMNNVSAYLVVAVSEYIYVIMENRQVFRLRCCDSDMKWEKMKDMQFHHGWRPPIAALNGFIYVVGGSGACRSDAAEKYDTASNEWEEIKSKNRSTWDNGLVSSNGCIYSIGGESKENFLNEAEKFDPSSSTWSTIVPMKKARRGPATVDLDGVIFVLGGCCDDGHGPMLSSVECFNTSSSQWTSVADMTQPRHLFQAFTIGEYIYAVGGHERFEGQSIERWNIDENMWEEIDVPKDKIKVYASAKVVYRH